MDSRAAIRKQNFGQRLFICIYLDIKKQKMEQVGWVQKYIQRFLEVKKAGQSGRYAKAKFRVAAFFIGKKQTEEIQKFERNCGPKNLTERRGKNGNINQRRKRDYC